MCFIEGNCLISIERAKRKTKIEPNPNLRNGERGCPMVLAVVGTGRRVQSQRAAVTQEHVSNICPTAPDP